MDRITQRSSTHCAVFGNRSLTGMPLRPKRLNLKGERNAAPVLRSVRRFLVGNFLPCHLSSNGLGSNVSTCDGPPLQKMWTTRLALAAKCGLPGSIGLLPALTMPANASEPMPMPDRARNSRRFKGGRFGRVCIIQSTNINSLDIIKTWASCSSFDFPR